MRQNMSDGVFKILYSFVGVFKILSTLSIFFFFKKKLNKLKRFRIFKPLQGGKNFELGRKNFRESNIKNKDRPRIHFLSFCDNDMVKSKVACNVLQPHLPNYLKGRLCACNCHVKPICISLQIKGERSHAQILHVTHAHIT